ncbi:hypothetical protein COO60DRAFT_1637015 [Scenedesmus sp. NREL 46B-D3]|nr:hypothetical protein COO60DRAFT_1637015 [Scenedesmus sp. NREL 46B-D3]
MQLVASACPTPACQGLLAKCTAATTTTHHQQQQQRSASIAPDLAAEAAGDAAASWTRDMPGGGRGATAVHNTTSPPQHGKLPPTDTAWPSPYGTITPQQLQPAQLGFSANSSLALDVTQQLPAAATRPYHHGSSSPASMPAIAGGAAGKAVQTDAEAAPLAHAAALDGSANAGAGADPRLAPVGSASSYESGLRHYAVPSAAAAVTALYGNALHGVARAAGSGSGSWRYTSQINAGSPQLSEPDVWGTDNANSSGMQRVFSSSMSSGGSFSCMPLPSAAAAAAALTPAAPSLGGRSPTSFTTTTSIAAAGCDSPAACATATSGAAAGGYSPAAAGGASSGALGLSVFGAAGLNLSSMCTMPGCTKCPPTHATTVLMLLQHAEALQQQLLAMKAAVWLTGTGAASAKGLLQARQPGRAVQYHQQQHQPSAMQSQLQFYSSYGAATADAAAAPAAASGAGTYAAAYSGADAPGILEVPGCNNTAGGGFTAAELQGKLLAQMSAAPAAAAQQQQRQFAASAPSHVTFAAGPEQQQLQPSTPQMGMCTLAGTWPAALTASATDSGYAAAATGGMSGGGCVRGAGDSFGGFCDVLLASGKGFNELLHTWGAEGDEGELESLARMFDDVDMALQLQRL